MDMDNSVGIAYGNGEWAVGIAYGSGEKGENWDNCNSINNKTLKKNRFL